MYRMFINPAEPHVSMPHGNYILQSGASTKHILVQGTTLYARDDCYFVHIYILVSQHLGYIASMIG
jgi:hypothetical protein